MDWINQLERRFGRFAIPGLTRGIVALQALVYILVVTTPGFEQALLMDPGKIREGEVWRLVTYIFLPRTMSPLWVLFALYILWIVGDALEQAWGAFKLNLYILLGILCMAVAGFLSGAHGDGLIFWICLFFAFATIYPNHTFLLFFILPVKVKWLALFAAGALLLQMLTPSVALRATGVAVVANYLLFFGGYWLRLLRDQSALKARRARFDAAKLPVEATLHRCAVCGRTEVSDPQLDFRVASDGEEYCAEHLPSAAAGREGK